MQKVTKRIRRNVLLWAMVLVFSAGGSIYYGSDIAQAERTVYITPTGSKYHTHKCGNGTYYPTTLSDAKSRGLTPCSKCFGSSSYSSGGSSSGSRGSSGGSSRTSVKPVSINKTSLLLVKGQSSSLKLRNASGTVRWSSTKKSVATVSNGRVTARKRGTAKIIARAGSQQKSCRVTVEEPKLSSKKVSLEIAEKKTLRLSGCKHSVKWTSSDSSVAKVKNGKITARDAGTTRIAAKVHGKKYICRVTVKKPELQSIALNPSSVQMSYHQETEIQISATPKNALKYYDLEVEASDPSVVSATVDDENSALLLESHATSAGAIVSLKVGNLQAQCQVSVCPCIIKSLTLEKTELTLKPNQRESLYCRTLPIEATAYYDGVWTSGDTNVVTVTQNGFYADVEAVGEGETDITVTIGGKSASCHVRVAKPEITTLTLEKTEMLLKPGETEYLYCKIAPVDAIAYYDPVWTSGDTNVVTVTQNESYTNVEAVGEGETDITVTIGNKSVVCHVAVRE